MSPLMASVQILHIYSFFVVVVDRRTNRVSNLAVCDWHFTAFSTL